MTENKGYTLYFDAYGQEGKTIQVQINGETFNAVQVTIEDTGDSNWKIQHLKITIS